MLITKNIIVPKHIRFFQSKEIEQDDEIWFLFHGYAQNIHDFYDAFKSFETENRCFILPEGPSKFYQKGVQGKVGASWMTKENRIEEIIDLNKYLNELIQVLKIENRKINIFAFSQGVATASRWAEQLTLKINQLVFWGSPPPPELKTSFWNLNPTLYFGEKDKYIDVKKFDNSLNTTQIITYPEGHIITKPLLEKYIFKKN